MYNFREGKKVIKVDELGSLYIKEDFDYDQFPLIYIGGQMEHRLHNLENRTGYTFDAGHNLFDGSWFYEYSSKKQDTKSNINALNFADNLVKSLEKANLTDVDIITESYGGLVAACASKSDRINKVVAIHPPILGTPLASNDMILDNLDKLERKNRRIAKWVNRIVDSRYGFQIDNSLGINNPRILDSIDLSKLTVVGSNLDRKSDGSKLACALYDIIFALTGKESDGVVLFDEEEFKRLGINYVKERKPTNHFAAGSEANIKRIAGMNFEDYSYYYVNDEAPELPDSQNDDNTFRIGSKDETKRLKDDIYIMSSDELFSEIEEENVNSSFKDEHICVNDKVKEINKEELSADEVPELLNSQNDDNAFGIDSKGETKCLTDDIYYLDGQLREKGGKTVNSSFINNDEYICGNDEAEEMGEKELTMVLNRFKKARENNG